MFPINAEFVKFEDITLYDLLDTGGVYVIWDSQAKARPTYVGEGYFMERLSQHDKRFALPLDGYISILGGRGNMYTKDIGQIVESALIRIGRDTDHDPKYNSKHGNWAMIEVICRSEKLKVKFTGYDPFSPPFKARRLIKPKIFEANYNHREQSVEYDHDWRKRRKLNIY